MEILSLIYTKTRITARCSRLLATAFTFLSCLSLYAQTDEPHTIPQAKNGEYVITTKEDFMALVTNPVYWTDNKTFVQLFDIDLEGEVITPIGNTSQPFTGIYDGKGNTLKNINILWDNDDRYEYGLFGYLYGKEDKKPATLRNLNLSNIHITRSDKAIETINNNNNDVKIGIVAGLIGQRVKIYDISLIGCKIDDGDKDTKVKAIMVGGLIGDFCKFTGSTDPIDIKNDYYVLKNIYADVDIDLQKVKRTSNVTDHQFFAGGIIGRIRTPSSLAYVPDNTVYTGTIKAPLGMISPTVANMRAKVTINMSDAVRTYAGEVGNKNDASTAYEIGTETFDNLCKTRLYYGYKVNDNANEVTETYPSGSKYAYGTRTFKENADDDGKPLDASKWKNNETEYWGRVQGVNFGKHTNPEDGTLRASVLDMLNSAAVSTPHFDWAWDETTQTFRVQKGNILDKLKVYIEPDYDANIYRLKVGLPYQNLTFDFKDAEAGDIVWESTTDLASDDWATVAGYNGPTIPVNSSLFFRVKWTYQGRTFTSDYIAPAFTVYVFNPETNEYFNSIVNQEVVPTFMPDAGYEEAGKDENNGLTPQTAVNTMERAFQIISEFGDMTSNRIVVMGYYADENYLATDTYLSSDISVDKYNKPVTITGTDNNGISDGIFALARSGSTNYIYYYLQAPLRFDKVTLCHHFKVNSQTDVKNITLINGANGIFFICNYFDLTLDRDVEILNFAQVSDAYGLPGNIRSLPFFTIVGGTEDSNVNPLSSPIKYPDELYVGKKGYYTEPGVTTLNLRSGCIARVICCARNDKKNSVSHNITGSYIVPNRIRLNVSYKDDIDIKNGKESTKYGKKFVIKDKKLEFASAEFSHNIGLISGGQTDGSAWGDVEMNIYAGHVARVITSNITFGRPTNDGNTDYPCDSFWGRTILNVYGKYDLADDGTVTSETTINEMFGGMLGRITQIKNKVRPYFYGKSVINMYGGYIGQYTGIRTDNNLDKLKSVKPNLYGVGSGGVTGLGYDQHHTSDPCIPYIIDGTVKYGPYETAKGNIPVMTMLDGEEIDLANTKCEINLYSGIILGSVYGGGYGYSNNISTTPIEETDQGVHVGWVYLYAEAPADLGVLYGDSKVTLHRHPDYIAPVVLGNVYGSGAGSDIYAKQYAIDFSDENNKFLGVASQYGNTEIIINDGTIGDARTSTGGDVYAGGQGIQGYDNIAALYGSTNLTVNGGTIYGNIYGGSELANINGITSIPGSGCTNVTINAGIIGNNIFGGSKGIDPKLMSEPEKYTESKATIAGSTNVIVNGGDFLAWPYLDLTAYFDNFNAKPSGINIVDNRDQYRTFNIYGGGYMNCDILGDANLKVYSSLLSSETSFVDPVENPNSLSKHDVSKFQSAYMDVTYRCFCVYGGGFGQNTNVLNTNVYVTIPRDRLHVQLPHSTTLDRFLDHQSFFDIAGGGYAGNVGYWVDANGDKLTSTSTIDDYVTYVGGNCKVTIDGYTYARKVIGGGFYGSCNNTNTHVRCGSLRQVYGGSLLGDVHQRAYLQFGNRIEDFIRKVDDSSQLGYHYEYDADGTINDISNQYQGDKTNVSNGVWADAEACALELNKYIFITENIYGGNDVKGIIGTKKLVSPVTNKPYPLVNGYPLFCTKDNSTKDNSTIEDCGIVFNIYGGTFMGDVYGAGNGHYRGYYVPEWVRYTDGPAHLYRKVKSGISSVSQDQKVYDGRPMVGNVNINIRGNSAIDRIHFTKNFYGGGRECTIGQWNTLLPVEDPRRLVEGGQLHVNFGGYTDIDGNVYMGSEGSLYASQPVVPQDANFDDYKGTNSKKTEYINKLGDIAYYHWYYDSDAKRYLPGFPYKDKVDGNYGICGEHMFRAYLKNIEMECDVKLTFYRNLYERNDNTNMFEFEKVGDDPMQDAYGNKLRKRKSWIPYEMAVADVTPSETKSESYDAPSITMTSFFLGGACGSMSNNKVMNYTYEDDGTDEKWPSIYRVSLPKGVTIKDAVVMGSQDAEIKTYGYNTTLNYKEIDKDALLYSFKGGMVTHSSIAFDLIVYNDKYHQTDPKRDLPADFYTSDTSDDGTEDYKSIKDIATGTSYTLSDGTTVYRKNYSTTDNTSLISLPDEVNNQRYDFAVLTSNGNTAYIGPRAMREGSSDHLTVVKLGASCTFLPQVYDDGTLSPTLTEDEKHAHRHGGIIYGGCYSSGITIGDVVLNVASDMLGDHYDINSPKAYGEFSRLKYNKGRVFGGGFGPNTDVQGNTYVNLINAFRGMNVFGGGMQGNVTGTANVTYIGEETKSYIYGAIYGGGLMGYVGDPNNIATNATVVSLYSGNVDKVYGGSCMGDLYGYAYVELTDKVQSDLDHLDYVRLKDKGYDWTDSRLIAGTVYGGNDITGNIYYDSSIPIPATDPETIKGPEDYAGYTTTVFVHEIKDEDAKITPGSDDGYNGFPLIGSLYGGSNGNYGVHGNPAVDGSVNYTAGEVSLATGTKTDFINIPLADKVVPTIDKAMVDIRGGTIIDAYTGGNKATLTRYGKIYVNYRHKAARAGFASTDELERVWNALHLSSEMQLDEVIKDYHTASDKKFEYNIFRLFGGNDNADMDIQPDVKLLKGDLGSVYSGGNFGAMTYYQKPVAADPTAEPPVEAVEEKGLSLTINSSDISIDNVYGGGRLGDITPMEVVTVTETTTDPETGNETTTTITKRQLVSNPGEDFYGATLYIYKGIIQHVYGGNDVSGYVRYGTNVNLYGAISGDVYCAGNGNYLYKYDRDASLFDYEFDTEGNLDTSNLKIIEDYAFESTSYSGARYFILPAKTHYGLTKDNLSSYLATDAETVMAINSYRPHVERAKIYIAGTDADNRVWIRGNVYCGGNSAAIVPAAGETSYDVEFEIGSHVILNGVFLGSNGSDLADGEMISNTESLNQNPQDNTILKMTGDVPETMRLSNPQDQWIIDNPNLYPKVLDLYMRAVETPQIPKGFNLAETITDTYIGEFCVGGNRGSIMTDKKISLDFPETVTVFGRIIGGCKNANVTYNGTTHIGGLTVPLAGTETAKVEMNVKCRFQPLSLLYPDKDADSGISMYNYMVDDHGNEISPSQINTFSGKKYYSDKQCNVYGGCFTSGKTVGGININLYSDMLNYKLIDEANGTPDPTAAGYIDRQAIIDGITKATTDNNNKAESMRSFTVVGGGYGAKTEVYGHINIKMLPKKTGEIVTHPSVASIFGGSQEGLVVGNTKVEIRDGKVLANVYGASEAAKMYGSTSVIVGYPKYYEALKTANYRLNRVDYMSKTSREDYKDEFDEVVVPKVVAYRAGDIVPKNVYEVINGCVKNARIKAVIDSPDFRVGKNVADKYVNIITDDSSATTDEYVTDLSTLTINEADDAPRTTYYIDTFFKPVVSSVLDDKGQPIADHIVPEDFGVNWKDITIWIGDQYSNKTSSATFYGQGNVYGGGYVPNSSDLTIIGKPTVMRFTKDYNLGYVSEFSTESQDIQNKALALYGGNTAVMIWDDDRCGKINETTGEYEYGIYSESNTNGIKEHVSVGSGYFKEVELGKDSSAKGYFEKVDKTFDGPDGKPNTADDVTGTAYIYITSGKAGETKEYYEKIADGGVYGGGRKVFAEALRSIDLAYYGYAEHTPQEPKLLNTIQRADIATITDCCIELVGASDFTINDPKGIYYAINRVGELRMTSSLLPNFSLDKGYTEETDGIRIHNKKRSRNYIALYNKTNHLGAFRSNWTLEQKYHLADGTVTTVIDNDTEHGYPMDGKESYVNHKHRFIDFYNGYAALQKKKDNDETFTKAEVDAVIDKYNEFTGESFPKKDEVSDSDLEDYLESIGMKMRDKFAERNVGTSGNMIGISSGYELSFEGLAKQRGEDYETKYYGPAYGVTEMKLLTTVNAMGGGYVYALNHHRDHAVDDYSDGKETPGWCSKFNDGKQDFLQTTGNFVFPGATYHTIKDGNETTNRNYIIDDCFDFFDVNHGYYQCNYHERDIIRSRAESGSTDPNINDSHEVHYWYVSGNTYVFNVVLTAITSDSEREFYLNNDNDRVNLFNVKKDTEIIVKEVNWFAHNDIPNDSCDIVNMLKKYKLYLTISNDPKNQLEEDSTDKNGAYVIRVPRFTYEAGQESDTGKFVNAIVGGDKDDYYDVEPDENNHRYIDPNYYLNADTNNNRFGYDSAGDEVADIKPRLGLRLVDAEHNRYAEMGKEWSTKYFEDHLKPDHMLQVVLETKNPSKVADEYTESIYFVINIDIKYLMGPAVYGNIKIENCALPGEYIYVNADDIDVVMDDNLGVSEQKWRLYPNDAQGYRYVNPDYKADYTATDYPELDAEIATSKELFYKLNTPEFTVAESEKLIHIPAYYYQNGWEPVYVVTANGENFECTLPYCETKEETDPDPENESKTITVPDRTKPILGNRLQVHNYHRMKPIYNGEVVDLRLCEGARIYIEDQTDMDYFFEYLDKMQTGAAPDGYKRFTLPTGLEVNPQYCDSLDFYLMTPLDVPTTTNAKDLTFAGRFHGMGHNLTIPDGTRYGFINKGRFHNLGFISNSNDDKSHAFSKNYGSLYNCFYFNTNGKGSFLGGGTKNIADNQRIANCYENTLTQDKLTKLGYEYNEILHLSTLGFRYGQAAYNLNGYYLQKRHILLHGPTTENSLCTENNTLALANKDKELRLNADNYTPYEVPYIESYYNHGDYQYAYTTSNKHPEALRTAQTPNYFDGNDCHSNDKDVSMHDYTHKVDELRWCDIHKEYHPLFDQDYLFFGEDLSEDTETTELLPEAYNPENRVYRAGGFYGSAADKGYFMNRYAFIDAPLMTAIDFVGYRDRDLYKPITDGGLSYGANGAHGALEDEVRNAIATTGWIIKNGRHEVFMPPTLDLPWTWSAEDGSDLKHDFSKFDVNSDKVTHNLLIYTENLPEAIAVLDDFHYIGKTYGLSSNPSPQLLSQHPDTEIRAHHIVDYGPEEIKDGEGNVIGQQRSVPRVYDDYMHLADLHDFNAPVEFTASEAWYNRQPQKYAAPYTVTKSTGTTKEYSTAWEGICLPFDIMKVYAASTNSTLATDMGEITHFYGDDWKGHEYWLRRLVGVESGSASDPDELLFERPTEKNLGKDADTNKPYHERVEDYLYTNTAIYDLYSDMGYDTPDVPENIDGTPYTHDLLYHSHDGQHSRTMKDYRYLSRNMPYVVAYPGKQYYEFDLSGEFYKEKVEQASVDPITVTAVPQTICYMANGGARETVTIPVTDDEPMAKYTAGTDEYAMLGTFKHVTDNKDKSTSVLYDMIPDGWRLGVLDGYEISTDKEVEVHNSVSFTLQPLPTATEPGKMVVMPFRTYVIAKTSETSPSAAPMIIGSRGISAPVEVVEDEDPVDIPAFDEPESPIKVWTEGRKLAIETPYDLETEIYNISGQLVRRIKAYKGINRYSGLLDGFYIVLRHKVYIGN